MGVKRPFDEETVQELSFKQAKQLDEDNKSIPVTLGASAKDVPDHVEDMELEAEFGEDILGDKDERNLQTNATLPWVTSSSAEEDAGSDGGYYLPLYPDFVDFNIPRRLPVLNEDAYSYSLNASPRKGVPVGPNHQADVPEWNPNAIWKKTFVSDDTIADDHDLNVAGTSIIPIPDPNVLISDDSNIGSGRNECTCLDKGSIRCVRQHVEEAREKLRGSLGDVKFAELGFNNMGEQEVASTWTEEEEYVFHEVIYTNPASRGKDFWKILPAVFPSRTNMELISYYFNVFILRRRAVQNRSDYLDIDSDDDEWQGDGRRPEVELHDDDSVVESFDDEDLHVDSEIGMSCEINNDDDDHDDDDNDDGDNDDGGDGDVGIDIQDNNMKGNQVEQVPPKPIESFEEDSEVINQVKNMAKVLSSNNAIYQERNSFPLIHESGGEHTAVQENGTKSEHIKFLGGKINGMNESFGSGFILEGCDTKSWDYAFSTSHLKSIDLLPTCNMIEEIFGPCAWNDN